MTANQHQSFFPDQHGFTLLEIVVSLIIASILGSMILVYVGMAYNKSVEPVTTSKRIMLLERTLEDINAIYAGLLDNGTLLNTFQTQLSSYSVPSGITMTFSKRFDFDASGEEPSSGSSTGNVLKVVLQDTTVEPNIELISLFYDSK